MGIITNFFARAWPKSSAEKQASIKNAALEKKLETLTAANNAYRERLEQRISQNKALRETVEAQKLQIETKKLKTPNKNSQSQTFNALNKQIKILTEANEKYRSRLNDRIEHNNTMQGVIKEQKAKLNANRTHNRRELTLDRIDTFFTGTKLKLPEEAFSRFLAKCEEIAPEGKVEIFLKEMEKTQYRAFFEQLFAVEMDMAQGFDFRGLGTIVSFQRGEVDIAQAAKQRITLDRMKANQIRLTKERFDDIIKPDFIDPDHVQNVCEIGAAWGAATRYIINRYSPETFHSYEIDTAWAQWLKDNLHIDSKQCDGESLSDTEDETMDICMASSCLYFMTFVKQWNYLAEFDRVLRTGGIAVFNVNVIESTSLGTLKGLLANHFPRRSFGYIPQHCIDTAFPRDRYEKLVRNPEDNLGYQVYRKL